MEVISSSSDRWAKKCILANFEYESYCMIILYDWFMHQKKMGNFEGLLLSWSIVSRILFEIRFSECNAALSNKLEKLFGWRILLIPKKTVEEVSHVLIPNLPSKIHYFHSHFNINQHIYFVLPRTWLTRNLLILNRP